MRRLGAERCVNVGMKELAYVLGVSCEDNKREKKKNNISFDASSEGG